MKTEIKTKWVEALRSGDYKQGKGRLVKDADEFNSTTSYCCLGVLAELASHEGVVEKREVSCGCVSDTCSIGEVGYEGDHGSADGKHRAGSFSVLPFPVMEWAGLDLADPMVRLDSDDFGERYLSGLNDSGYDFDEIAHLIEEQL